MNSRAPIVIPISICVAGLASVVLIAQLLDNGILPVWNITENKLVNLTFTTQFMVLPMSFVALIASYFYDKENFKIFFRFSFKSPDKTWDLYGPLVAIGFTLGNVMMMSFGVISQNGVMNETFFLLLPLVILFSITNAWSEEIFSRFVIVSGLHGKMKPETICFISAAIFGLGHIMGTPSGLFGVVASGALGWFLARSVVDTRSLGWAWLIHFLQDVVIFGSGAMIIAGNADR